MKVDVPIYRRQQPIIFRLVAARVSLCMTPVACAVAPRAPHGGQHDQHVMQGDTTSSTCLICGLVACRSTPHRPHVDQHASIADTTTSRASACQSACAASMHADTSCLCRQTAYQMVDTTSWWHALIPRASRSIYTISTLSAYFRSAINLEYFSAPVMMSWTILINSSGILTLTENFLKPPASSKIP